MITIWDLVELPNGFKIVHCEWVFKAKHDSKGYIEYTPWLVANGFTQKDGIEYKESFSPVSNKDSLIIVLSLVAYYYLNLQHIDVKKAFLNGEIEDEVYMDQHEDFLATWKNKYGVKLRKSIHGVKQASRKWYLKFNDTIMSYGFIEIFVERFIYIKVSGSRIVI